MKRRDFIKSSGAFGLLSAVEPGILLQTLQTTPAFQLFTNGAIYLDADRKVNNLLVSDGIVAGLNVDPVKYPQAEIIDLHGAAAYPGFNDSHVHLLESGYVFQVGVDLLGCNNADDMARTLAEKVKNGPSDGTVIGAGFSLRDYDKWSLADLAKIDAVAGAHPTFLADKLGHNAVINSAAIKLAGLTSATKVPLGGKMGLENGRPTGIVRESAMTLAWDAISAHFRLDDMKAGVHKLATRWASMGYTAVVDLMGGPGIRFMRPDVFWDLENDGKLPLRVNYCFTIFNLNDVDLAAKYVGRDTAQTHFVGCKIFVDGAFAGGQAWTSWANQQGGHGLQEIYADDRGGPEMNLNRIVAKVEEYGMNMHYHTQGDQAIGAVLDALDKVRANKGQIRGIHTLIHLAFPTDEQIKRIKGFNGRVVVTVQPGFWPVENDTAYYYGERAAQAYPIKKLFDSGISVGMSTDFNVSPPQYTPAAVVIGVAATGGGDPNQHPPVKIKDVVRGLTLGSSRTTGKDDVGALDIGRKADIVIYERDLVLEPPAKLSAQYPKVLATYVAGRQMYAAGK